MNKSFNKKLVSFTLISMFMMLSASFVMASGKVVLYSAHKQAIIDAMIPLFEKKTGINAEVIKAGSGDIINRANAEKGNPQADVIWSIGGEQLEASSDILQKYTPKDANNIDPVFMVGTN